MFLKGFKTLGPESSIIAENSYFSNKNRHAYGEVKSFLQTESKVSIRIYFGAQTFVQVCVYIYGRMGLFA